MRILLYIGVVVTGFAAGWQLKNWTAPPAELTSPEIVEPVAVAPVGEKSTDKIPSPEANQPEATGGQAVEESAAQFLARIAAMDRETFAEFQKNLNRAHKPLLSDQLTRELLQVLLDISDPETRFRVIDLLQNARFSRGIPKQPPQTNIEDWAVREVLEHRRAEEWLGVLSFWGIESNHHALELASQLPQRYSEQARVSTMLALSKKFGTAWMPNNESYQELASKINQFVLPYVDSDSASERAAALRAIGAFPGESNKDIALAALQDPSDLVQQSGIRTLTRHSTNISNETLQPLLVKMLDENTSSHLRMEIYETLRYRAQSLDPESYQVIYAFGRDHAISVREKASEYHQSQGRTPWN